MEQGNPNKVSAIVDEIVRNNAMFKLKSPIERDKEKYSMEKSINTALSELNETGKELVLEELAVNPDEKFKGFIDNAGNIDISGILKFTSSVVKVKIEEAQREGINLRKDGPEIVNGTNFKPEDVIAMAAIGEMISNYENLTDKQKAMLLDKDIYMSMSDEDRKRVNDSIYKDASKRKLSEEQRKKLNQLKNEISINEAFIDIKKKNPNMPYEQILIEIGKLHPKLSIKQISEQCKKYYKPEMTLEESEKAVKENSLIIATSMQQIAVLSDYNQLKDEGKTREAEELLSYYGLTPSDMKQISLQIDSGIVSWEDNTADFETQTVQLEAREDNVSNEDKNNAAIGLSEIEGETQLYQDNELINENNSKKMFENVPPKMFDIYISTLKSFNKEEIEGLKEIESEVERQNILKDFFKDEGISEEIAEILSNIDFDGHIFEFLENEEKRNQFFEELEQIKVRIVQEKSKNEEDVTPITDTDVEQGVRQGTLKQEELIVDTASVRTAYGDDEGTINVEVIDAGQVEQGENVKPLKSVSSFMGLISNEKEKLSESDLGEAVTEVEVASQKFEQDRQAAQGNIDPQQANLAQEQLINEEDLEQ